MGKAVDLSRRERQIMDALFALGSGTVKQIRSQLPEPPTDMAVRRLIHILEEKGHLKRRQNGREVVYSPRRSRRLAGAEALRHVVDTFFGGAVEEALAAHLAGKESLDEDQIQRMQQLIDQARKEGR